MATSKVAGGLYYVGGTAVDANGKAVEDAPKLGKDTPADQQPGAAGSASTPEERMAAALTAALAPRLAAPAPAKKEK